MQSVIRIFLHHTTEYAKQTGKQAGKQTIGKEDGEPNQSVCKAHPAAL